MSSEKISKEQIKKSIALSDDYFHGLHVLLDNDWDVVLNEIVIAVTRYIKAIETIEKPEKLAFKTFLEKLLFEYEIAVKIEQEMWRDFGINEN